MIISESSVPIKRAFADMDGVKEPQEQVYVSLEMGIVNSSAK